MENMPKAIILSGYGINCEKETKEAFELAGASADIVHVNDLIKKEKKLEDYHIFTIPGGFSYGDDTGSGNALANKLRFNLKYDIFDFVSSGKLVIGICNGFQVLVNLGLLPGFKDDIDSRSVALTHNNSARYECRWVYLKVYSKKCIFTKGIDIFNLPVAHGEGNFFAEQKTLDKLNTDDQVVFRYCDMNGNPVYGRFPENPNSSMQDIAGICDNSGRVLGMMPHPERAIYNNSYPQYPKQKELLERQGETLPKINPFTFAVFKNAVDYAKENFMTKN
ncbi:MAG: phosphoribosylformylglycinamidine synthase I [archaeon]|nr:phosphoribosylformylglycinamidine synthase I [archaeon]